MMWIIFTATESKKHTLGFGGDSLDNKEGMRDWRAAQVLDTGQTGTRISLHNSCVYSYGPAIHDWVAFMSIGEKGSRGVCGERQKDRRKRFSFPCGQWQWQKGSQIVWKLVYFIKRRKNEELFTISCSEETLVAATDLVGQVLSDVHMCMHLVPYLFKRRIQVGLPEPLIQTIYELG